MAAIAAAAFAWTASAVASGRAALFDRAVAAGLGRLDSPITGALMRSFSAAGSSPFVLAVVAAVVLWQLRSGDRGGALALTAIAAGNEVLNLVLKHLFHRLRPEHLGQLESFSFPSGHAMAAAGTYGMAAVLLVRVHPRLQIPLCILAPLTALLVGSSRIFLGFHYASDVLAGFSAGVVVLIVSVRLTAFRRNPGTLASA